MLDSLQRKQFALHGVVTRVPVLSAEEAGHYREGCRKLVQLLGGAPRTIDVRQMHLHFPWAYELATHPKVLDAAEGILGPNLLVWATELFAKPAGDPNLFIAWHRDKKYMGFDSSRSVTAWVSLARSFPENGCLQVVLEGEGRRTPGELEGSTKKNGGVPPQGLVTNIVLEPGEMSMHDLDVFHGSGPNVSEEERVGFAIRFITPEARHPHDCPAVVVARGETPGSHFELASRPSVGDAVQALEAMRVSAQHHFEAMLKTISGPKKN